MTSALHLSDRILQEEYSICKRKCSLCLSISQRSIELIRWIFRCKNEQPQKSVNIVKAQTSTPDKSSSSSTNTVATELRTNLYSLSSQPFFRSIPLRRQEGEWDGSITFFYNMKVPVFIIKTFSSRQEIPLEDYIGSQIGKKGWRVVLGSDWKFDGLGGIINNVIRTTKEIKTTSILISIQIDGSNRVLDLTKEIFAKIREKEAEIKPALQKSGLLGGLFALTDSLDRMAGGRGGIEYNF